MTVFTTIIQGEQALRLEVFGVTGTHLSRLSLQFVEDPGEVRM